MNVCGFRDVIRCCVFVGYYVVSGFVEKGVIY